MGEWQKRKINSQDSLQIPVSEAPAMRESVSTTVTTEISDEMHKTETEMPLTEESMEDEPAELTEEFASAPEHMDAHLVTKFEDALNEMKAKAVKKTGLTGLPGGTDKSLLRSAYDKFANYIGIRKVESACSKINTSAQRAKVAIRKCIDKKKDWKDELESLKGLSTEKKNSNRIEELNAILLMIKELESFLAFVEKDNYSGSLDAKGATKYADRDIGMETEDGEDEDGFDYTISYSYKDATSQPLFHRPPTVNDVRQGGLGDCYLLAGLASIVATDPSLITRSMKDLGKHVCVQFYKAPYGPTDIVKVRVEKTVPEGVMIYKDPNKKNKIIKDPFADKCLWVQMIEKAYTASGLRTDRETGKRVYQDIEGGFSHVFIQQMTGRKCKIRSMAANGLLDKGNSLIGVYSDMQGYAYSRIRRRISKKLKLYGKRQYIDREHLVRAAIAIHSQLQSTGISIKDAVEIAIKMEDEEKKTHLKTGTGGKTIPGKAMVLTDLYRILKNTRLTVPKGHIIGEAFIAEAAVSLGIIKQGFDDGFIGDIFDQKTIKDPQHKQMAADIKLKYGQEGRFISKDDSLRMAAECERRLDQLAVSKGITLYKAGEKVTDGNANFGTREQKLLADRIRQTYTDRNMFIREIDALTLAIAYEEAYKHALAEAMIRKLKARKDMALAYSIFYSRTGKHGNKKRYTHNAKEIYGEIENAISRGAIVTAGTVSYHRKGDSATKAGLVEGHAYSVLGTMEKDGARFIRLRNPWGSYTRKYKKGIPKANRSEHGEGTFIMELNDFVSKFREYRINEKL